MRHCCRTYLIGANLTIPTFFVMTRKSYGLGKLAMTGGSMRVGMFAVAWPTGEFGGMGLEGQVKLGRRRELAAIEDPAERLATYEKHGRRPLRARQGAQRRQLCSMSTR